MITHIMVDLETFGNDPKTGPLIAFGAVAFAMNEPIPYPTNEELAGGVSSQKFYFPMTLQSQLAQYKYVPDAETLEWWLAPEREIVLRNMMTSVQKQDIYTVFTHFVGWLKMLRPQEIRLWSHGVTYDCMHLSQKWPGVMGQSFNHVCPYKHMRDTRTLFELYETRFGLSPYPKVERHHHHHPLEDAWIQAIAVQTASQELTHG